MGVVTPNGDMYLLYVDIDPANQLYFTSKTAQETFFQSKAVAGVAPADYTFIRKDEYVRVDRNADLLYNANYLMYRNTAHANRWFYAYIKEIKWLSDFSSAISFEVDPYQTWLWDISFRQSLIERETPPTDYLGQHLLDEGLDLGEYITSYQTDAGLGDMSIVVATTIINAVNDAPIETPWGYTRTLAEPTAINNVFSGGTLLFWPNTAAGVAELKDWLKGITAAGASDAITAIYMCPTSALQAGGNFAPAGTNLVHARYVQSTFSGSVTSIELPQPPISIEGYVPRNKKLLSPPYCLIYGHNGNGSSAMFDQNEFNTWAIPPQGAPTNPSFQVYGNVNPMPQFKLVPKFYKGVDINLDEAMTLQSFPMCSYPIDAYKAWMAQNGTSNALGVAGGAIGAAASIGTAVQGAAAGAALGGPAGAVAGAGVAGVMAIASITQATQSLAKREEAKLAPPHAQGSANSGSVNSAISANDFYIGYKTIRKEWAGLLDQYFDMYGYKVNAVKAPSFGCRTKWYYCKLINANITGGIPLPELSKIKQMFENGVTLWNNHADIGQYHVKDANGQVNPPVGLG